MRFSAVLISIVLFSAPNLRSEDSDVWMTWRGPNRDSVIQNDRWPDSLEESRLQLVWTKPFGDSYSGPLITENSVITTETDSGKERVTCLDRLTGEVRWSRDWDGSMKVPFFAAENGSWIRSTPATDGNTLFVGGIRDVLVALDCETGAEKWRVDFGDLAGKVPDFGMVCSPLIDGEHLYVQAGKAVHKLSKSNGSILWSAMQDGGDIMTSGAFSSPVISAIQGKRQLVVQSRTTLAGIDLESGSTIWKHEVQAFRGMNILTPTVWKDGIFTSSYGGRSLLLKLNGTEPKVEWENKIEGYMSSPVVIDHYVYMHLRNNRFACVDLETGKEAWISRPYGKYWSMVTNGKRILALDQNGKLRLIAHNPEKYELLSERKIVEEDAWAHVAVAGDHLVIRSQRALSLFHWK